MFVYKKETYGMDESVLSCVVWIADREDKEKRTLWKSPQKFAQCFVTLLIMCGVWSTYQNQPEIADVMLVEGIWQVNSLSKQDYKTNIWDFGGMRVWTNRQFALLDI